MNATTKSKKKTANKEFFPDGAIFVKEAAIKQGTNALNNLDKLENDTTVSDAEKIYRRIDNVWRLKACLNDIPTEPEKNKSK